VVTSLPGIGVASKAWKAWRGVKAANKAYRATRAARAANPRQISRRVVHQAGRAITRSVRTYNKWSRWDKRLTKIAVGTTAYGMCRSHWRCP
jgi:hypothetical protein